MKHDLSQIVPHFQIDGELLTAEPYGSGHINDTYVSVIKTAAGEVRFVHQRINHNIFKQPEQLMENIDRVTKHLRMKIEAAGGDPMRETLNLIPCTDGKCFYKTPEGDYWRTYVFVEGARTYDLVENLDQVYNASYAFGRFQEMISDLPAPRLNETIPDFHNTRWRFEAFVEALDKDVAGRAADVQAEIDFALARKQDASVLVDLLAAGELPERITHNDTKFNNVMLDDVTGVGLCVIDLDTVMPGLAMYDFGDSVRVGTNPAAEDELDLSKVTCDLEMFERLVHGYLDAARGFLTDTEKDYLAFSAKLITLEIGLRFLTDHLAGDVYFKVHRDNHNLDRCRTQFKMVGDMEADMDKMEAIVKKYR